MSNDLHAVPEAFKQQAHIDDARYQEMYAQSVSDPEAFWAEQGKRLDWITPYSKVKNTTYEYPNVSIKWYEDGQAFGDSWRPGGDHLGR